MTTRDVIRALLAAGWRWDFMNGPDYLPVLTNTPKGYGYCIEEGDWMRVEWMRESGICRDCYNERQLRLKRERNLE